AVERWPEVFLRLREAAAHDRVVDRAALHQPPRDVAGKASDGREPPRPVEGDPAHELGKRELLLSAADFPDPFVRLPPVVADPVGDAAHARPELVADRPGMADGAVTA